MEDVFFSGSRPGTSNQGLNRRQIARRANMTPAQKRADTKRIARLRQQAADRAAAAKKAERAAKRAARSKIPRKR